MPFQVDSQSPSIGQMQVRFGVVRSGVSTEQLLGRWPKHMPVSVDNLCRCSSWSFDLAADRRL